MVDITKVVITPTFFLRNLKYEVGLVGNWYCSVRVLTWLVA